MSLTCKKCNFVNEAAGASMNDACPSCGAIYSKVEAYLAFMADKQRREAEQKKLEAEEAEKRENVRQDAAAKQADRERQEAEQQKLDAESAEASKQNAPDSIRAVLVDCAACGTKISAAAVACPKCGHPASRAAILAKEPKPSVKASRRLAFKTFIAPQFGVVVFWIIGIPSLIASCIEFATGQWIVALITLAFVLGFRIFFEAMTVLFQIHDVLVEMRDRGASVQ